MVILVLLGVVLDSTGAAGFYQEKPGASIDKLQLKTEVKTLSAKTFQGRGTGSEGQKLAGEYIASRLKQFEVLPYQSNFFQPFDVHAVSWDSVYLKSGKNTYINFDKMAHMGHEIIDKPTSKKLVFAGRAEEGTLKKLDLKGNVALVFVENLRAYYAISKVLKAEGVYAVLYANPDNSKQFTSIKNTYADHKLSKRLYLGMPPSATSSINKMANSFIIDNSIIKALSGKSVVELRQYMEQKIEQKVPVKEITLLARKKKEVLKTENIVGVVPGKTDSLIVISAHYDHLGQKGQVYFPGADDNASGVAALLALARVFSKRDSLKYSLLFLATSGEEAGLLGSKFFVEQSYFNPEKVVYAFNLDMMGRVDDLHIKNSNYIYCIGTEPLPNLKNTVEEVGQNRGLEIDFSMDRINDATGVFHRSDQFNFYKKGIAAVFFYSGTHQDYHKSTDTWQKINFKVLQKRTLFVADLLEQLSR